MKRIRRHVEATSETSSGNPPGGPSDAVEYARGQLSAMAYLSATATREVHILRLRNSFDRAGIVHKLRYSLWVLDLMREAQELRGGYWFPTPLRAVPLDGKAILVGSAPTRELQRHFSGVARAGYARVLAQSDARGLPIQELDDWLGLHVQDSIAWSEAQIAEAQRGLGPTISPGNIQFFSVRTSRSTCGYITIPEWTDSPMSPMKLKGMFLCRERLGHYSFRYFFGKVEGQSIVAESSTPLDVARLCSGFAALMGRPITVTIHSRNAESIIKIPGNLPRPERQLILALGARDMSLQGKAYRVRNDIFVSLIAARLKHLGCEVRGING